MCIIKLFLNTLKHFKQNKNYNPQQSILKQQFRGKER